MNGCQTCGGFGNRHDPIAHGTEWEPAGEMTHDDIAEIVFHTLNQCRIEGIHDTLRQSHAAAVALLLAEADR